jgi:hypothetical protein
MNARSALGSRRTGERGGGQDPASAGSSAGSSDAVN